MQNTVLFPSVNAIDKARMLAVNGGYGNTYNYNMCCPSTNLDVPVLSECPCCHKVMAIDTLPIIAVNNGNKSDDDDIFTTCEAISVYRCSSCNGLFAVHSKHVLDESSQSDDDDFRYSCEVIGQFPLNNNVTSFSDEICNLSEDFVEVYHQSELAEFNGLDMICGMGYRRSIEFLVDAYAKHKNPSDSIDSSKSLSAKIQTYISDERIRVLAQRATWIGNDFTHIVNRHPDRNISDMKKFINAMVHLIDTDFAFEDAESIQ